MTKTKTKTKTGKISYKNCPLVTKSHTSKYRRHAPKSHGWPLEKLRTFSKMVLQNKLKFLCNKKFSSASAGAGAIIKNWRAVRKCVRNNYKGATVRAPHSKNPRNPTSENNSFHHSSFNFRKRRKIHLIPSWSYVVSEIAWILTLKLQLWCC